ncbi:MAG: PilN domain-containing protein [Rhodomicrobium sp.]
MLRSLNHGKVVSTASIDVHDGKVGPLEAELLEQTKGSQIEIVVPDTAILENQLDPLPAESRPYVDSVVRHRIETLFPWRAADTLFAADIAVGPDGRLMVNVLATPRGAVAATLDVAMACGANEVVIVSESEQNAKLPKVIPAFSGRDSQLRFERARSNARYAVLGLILLAFAVAGNGLLTQAGLRSDIDGLDQTIAERRAVLQLRSDRQTTLSVLELKKRETAIAVLVLEELSKILPARTYLTDFTLDAGQLRIAGLSAHAADLIPLLEGTGHFKNATFYAPTTRQGEGMDHFSIDTSVIPNTTKDQ